MAESCDINAGSDEVPERVEYDKVPERVEHDEVAERVEHDEVPKRVEHDEVPGRVEHDKVPERVEHDKVPERVEHDEVAERVEHDEVPKRVEHDKVPGRVEHDKVPERVEHDKVPERVEHDEVAERVEHDEVPKRVEHDKVPGRVEHDKVPGRVEQILCKPCFNNKKRATAEKFCSTCDEFQCLDCSNVHYTHNFFKNHKLVNVNEAKMKQNSFDMKGLDQCDQHQEVLKFFCEDENQLCCSTCGFLYHRKCRSVLEIQKVAKRVFLKSSQLKNKFENVRQKTEIIVNIIVSSKEKLGKDVKQIPVKIRQMRDKEMKMFDELKISVVKDVESFKKETLKN
ncbi:uncharacterized protein LOC132747774 [Ruditapes philippinarum]|uniref:uncharacterized protein LOC132747774 n=1 Tax=Ruditapes philippinarum TaxID=129788 RepID=UPI00295B4BA4|nr:uncharacterized protein LOC132747774 [Ruditapes philippinarum]